MFYTTEEALLQTAPSTPVLRLVTLRKTFCCERAVVFEKEVSIHIIELPGVRA